MSYFAAKMHQIRFRLGLHPRPRWGAYSAKGRGREGREGRGERRGDRGGKGPLLLGYTPLRLNPR